MANTAKMIALSKKIEVAEEAMLAELRRAFPVGRAVSCWLMHGQVNPSTGVVLGHRGGRYAYVTVRLDSRSRLTRDIPASEVRLRDAS